MSGRGGIIKVTSFDGGAFIYPTATAQDRRLTLAARGLLTELASRPNDWRTHVDELARGNGLSLPTIRKLLNELIAFGYCKRWQDKGKDGRRGAVNYCVCLDPSKLDDVVPVNHCDRKQVYREAVKPHSGEIAATYKRGSTQQRKDLPSTKHSKLSHCTSLTEQAPREKSAVGQLDEVGLKGKGRAPRITPDLIERAHCIGLDVPEIEAEARRLHPAKPSRAFGTLCRVAIGQRLPGLEVGVIAAAMAGEDAALSRVIVGWKTAGAIR